MTTKILIVLRAGSASLHRAWTRVCAGAVHVAISLYDDAAVEDAEFVVVHRCRGGKFTGLQAFFADHPAMIDAYTHFWLLDDDLYVPFDSLVQVQDLVARWQFALCAPSLAPESFMSWAITVQNSAFHLRATDFVEIMAPIMSRGFLRRALPLFAENHSGWGYEWLWRTILQDMGTFAAILDAAPIVHARPLGTGTLYAGGVNGADEARALFAKYAIDPDAAPFRNLFGLARSDRRPVFGADFLARALEGYESLRRHDPAGHARCLEFLESAPPALESAAALRGFPGAGALVSTLAG
jgi:hypothetical protein